MATIRKGTKDDLPSALQLIRELAKYEKAEHEVNNTLEMMEKDGFGDHPVYAFMVAEEGNEIIGLSLYYFRYSTWKGKRLYLEDLIVTESKRGNRIGKRLFEATLAIAKESGCTGMMWQVLDWNEPAIQFYKKYDTHFESGWINCSMNC